MQFRIGNVLLFFHNEYATKPETLTLLFQLGKEFKMKLTTGEL